MQPAVAPVGILERRNKALLTGGSQLRQRRLQNGKKQPQKCFRVAKGELNDQVGRSLLLVIMVVEILALLNDTTTYNICYV